MTRQMTLQELYDKYLQEFKKYKRRPNLSLLLTLLLLKDKDKLQKTSGPYEDFLEKNGSEFYERANKVMKDFSITVEELRRQYDIRTSFWDDNWVVSYVFGNAVDTLMRAWQLSSQYSSEELYNKLCRLEDGEPLPYIRDNEIPYSNLSTLQKKYRQYLNRFKRDGKRPHPAKLLALLILEDKEKYINLSEEKRKAYIDDKIKQLMIDFELSELHLFVNYPIQPGQKDVKKEIGILCNPKIKQNVFGKCLTIISGEVSCLPTSTSETLYDKFCDLFEMDGITFESVCDYFTKPLKWQYNKYLTEYKKTGKRPHPAELLALLVLQDIDKYRPKNGEYSSSEFDTDPDFNNKIEQVIGDFQFSDSELYYTYDKSLNLMNETYGDEKGKLTNPKLKNRIFCCVRSALFSGLINYPNSKPEEIYNELYFLVHGRPVPIEQQKESLPKYKPKCRQRKPIRSIPTTGFNF